MAKEFNTHVAVHRDPADVVWFAPGDEVPDWALELVGDHVYGDSEEADDVRLTDPHYEDDDPETEFRTTTDLPPANAAGAAEESDEDLVGDYSELSKDELKSLAEERGLAVSGNKAELIARLEEDDAAEEDEDEE